MKISLINRSIVFFLDLSVCFIGYLAAIWIQQHTFVFTSAHLIPLVSIGSLFLMFTALGFYCHKSYRVLIRHSDFREMWRIFASLVFSCTLMFIALILLGYTTTKVLFFVFNTFLLCFFMIFLYRLITVSFYNYTKRFSNKTRKKTLVYGTGPHSLALTNWMNRSSHSSHNIQGFITRDVKIKNARILDKPVYYIKSDNFDWILNKHEISTILFPDYNSVRLEKDFISSLVDKGLSLIVIPPLEGVDNKSNKKYQMKPILLEDLLGRDEIKIDMERIFEQSNDKTILVTGAAGSIGSELVRQLSGFNPKLLVLFDAAETPLHNLKLELENDYPNLKFVPVIGDVRNLNRIEFVFKNYHPEIVYHAAAYKHVPLMEENPCEAVRVNILGTRILCDTAIRNNVECFVMISTDKAVKPTNVMGASKRIAEIYVQSLAKKTQIMGNPVRIITTRFGNVLGSNGSVIPRFREQIENGGPVTVTDPEIIRYFMTIPEACRLVLEAASFGNNGEIYVFDMGSPVKISDLAKRMIILAGYKPGVDIKIRYTGLRPGEKMYEELLNDKETTLPTSNEKITVAQVSQYNFDLVLKATDKIIENATYVDIDNTVKEMKLFLSDFVSQNSPFQKFDFIIHDK